MAGAAGGRGGAGGGFLDVLLGATEPVDVNRLKRQGEFEMSSGPRSSTNTLRAQGRFSRFGFILYGRQQKKTTGFLSPFFFCRIFFKAEIFCASLVLVTLTTRIISMGIL